MFSKLNLRQKIIILITVASSCVVVFASILWGYHDIKNLRREMIEDLATTASELSKGIRKDVKEDNRARVIRSLSSLRDNPGIISAWIVSVPSGKITSGYLNVTDYTRKNMELLDHNYVKTHIDKLNQNHKHAEFYDQSLLIKAEIIMDKQVVGYLYMFSSISKLQARIEEHAQVVLLISLLSIFLSMLLAYGMHRSISKPIVDLAKIMDTISRKKDYSLRIKVATGRDEVHELMSIFNEMISEIEHHTHLQKQSEAAVKKLAYFDTLTKMPNRQLFQEYLTLVIRNCKNQNQSCALFFIDLNKFKQINDSLGHEVGDLLLKSLADRIRVAIKPFDENNELDEDHINIVSQDERILASRIGGDEFTIIIPTVDKKKAESIANSIIQECGKPLLLGGQSISPSVSIGIAFYPDHALNQSDLVKAADLSMYKSKEKKLSTYTIYQTVIGEEFNRSMQVDQLLGEAVKSNDFTFLYDPIVNVATGKIIGAEMLIFCEKIAMFVPSRELFAKYQSESSKKQFLELVGNAVGALLSRVAPTSKDFLVSFKISLNQVESIEFWEYVLKKIDSNAMNPSNLILELPQDIFAIENKKITRNLTRLQEMGVHLAMDILSGSDTTLANLPQLHFDYLKIDKEFFENIIKEVSYIHIFKMLLDLSTRMKLQLIAEGIKYSEQVDFIRQYNCQYCQGSYYYEPLSREALLKEISNI